jgi:hypothetical protein
MRDAAQLAVRRFTYWFGALSERDLTLHSPRSRRMAQDSMTIEAQVVADVARHWWGDAIRLEAASDLALRDGLVSYLSGFVLEEIYGRRFGIAGRSADRTLLFSGQVTWSFPGLAISRELVIGDTPSARMERTLLTLERLLGHTAMERALHVVAQQWRGNVLSREALIEAIGVVAGRDLSWFLSAIDDRIDYAVQTIGPRSITVARLGDGIFPGTSQQVIGPYDAGRAIEIEVRFADGQRVVERWDGRDRTRTYEYEAAADIVAATVDPRRVLVVDANRLNNTSRLDLRRPVNVTQWMARWSAWLQNTLLTAAVVL